MVITDGTDHPITDDYPGQSDDAPLTTSDMIDHLRRAYWIFRVTSVEGSGELRPIRLLSILGIVPLATVLVAWREGTLFLLLKNGGRGLFEHVGWWSQYLACPILVILALQVVRSFATILADSRFVAPTDEDALATRLVQQALLRRCCASTVAGKRQLAELFVIGGASVIINMQTTQRAFAVYGEDVWDSSFHMGGYWLGKIFLVVEWGYLLPVLAFLALSIGTTIHYIVRRAVASHSQQLSVFAADGCGGYRPLGQLMLRIVYQDVPIAAVIVCLHFTHDKHFYYTIIFATGFLIVVIVAQLFLPFVPLHERLSQLKRTKLRELEEFLLKNDRQLLSATNTAEATAILAGACVYQQTMQLSTWPYARRDALKALTPLVPIASMLLRLLAR